MNTKPEVDLLGNQPNPSQHSLAKYWAGSQDDQVERPMTETQDQDSWSSGDNGTHVLLLPNVACVDLRQAPKKQIQCLAESMTQDKGGCQPYPYYFLSPHHSRFRVDPE
jgi:hypothetical protein